MARLNTAETHRVFTHEGGPAFPHITPEQALRRSVMSCFLWEREFYEDGASIADRIAENAAKVEPETLAEIAIEARSKANLRHVPLLLLEVLTRTGKGRMVGDTIAEVIQRADEPGEFLAICKARGMKTLSKQMKVGLARAIKKFNEYQLAKYNRDAAYKLRDVMFLTHSRPNGEDQEALFKRLAANELETPDTWEVSLSGGANKRETFERLLREGKLGYLALLRNLRNMAEAGVDITLVRDAILARKGGAHRVLPFRYVAAARAAPQFEPYLDQALCEAISEIPPLSGKTAVLVDVSGSMDWGGISGKSDLKRIDAAAALGAIVHGDIRLFTFSDAIVEVPPRRGMAGVDAIARSQPHVWTNLGGAVAWLNQNVKYDRLIVITDEQTQNRVPDPTGEMAYMINVASYKNGVGYGRWNHIDGFSENVIRWIQEYESFRVA